MNIRQQKLTIILLKVSIGSLWILAIFSHVFSADKMVTLSVLVAWLGFEFAHWNKRLKKKDGKSNS